MSTVQTRNMLTHPFQNEVDHLTYLTNMEQRGKYDFRRCWLTRTDGTRVDQRKSTKCMNMNAVPYWSAPEEVDPDVNPPLRELIQGAIDYLQLCGQDGLPHDWIGLRFERKTYVDNRTHSASGTRVSAVPTITFYVRDGAQTRLLEIRVEDHKLTFKQWFTYPLHERCFQNGSRDPHKDGPDKIGGHGKGMKDALGDILSWASPEDPTGVELFMVGPREYVNIQAIVKQAPPSDSFMRDPKRMYLQVNAVGNGNPAPENQNTLTQIVTGNNIGINALMDFFPKTAIFFAKPDAYWVRTDTESEREQSLIHGSWMCDKHFVFLHDAVRELMNAFRDRRPDLPRKAVPGHYSCALWVEERDCPRVVVHHGIGSTVRCTDSWRARLNERADEAFCAILANASTDEQRQRVKEWMSHLVDGKKAAPEEGVPDLRSPVQMADFGFFRNRMPRADLMRILGFDSKTRFVMPPRTREQHWTVDKLNELALAPCERRNYADPAYVVLDQHETADRGIFHPLQLEDMTTALYRMMARVVEQNPDAISFGFDAVKLRADAPQDTAQLEARRLASQQAGDAPMLVLTTLLKLLEMVADEGCRNTHTVVHIQDAGLQTFLVTYDNGTLYFATPRTDFQRPYYWVAKHMLHNMFVRVINNEDYHTAWAAIKMLEMTGKHFCDMEADEDIELDDLVAFLAECEQRTIAHRAEFDRAASDGVSEVDGVVDDDDEPPARRQRVEGPAPPVAPAVGAAMPLPVAGVAPAPDGDVGPAPDGGVPPAEVAARGTVDIWPPSMMNRPTEHLPLATIQRGMKRVREVANAAAEQWELELDHTTRAMRAAADL